VLSSDTDKPTKKPTTTATDQQQPQQPVFSPSQYPRTDSAITARFPACSAEYRARIVRAALALGDPRTNDEIIAKAIEAATIDGQKSAALYLKTVPETLAAWLRDAERRKIA
jgi:hypothetical protein